MYLFNYRLKKTENYDDRRSLHAKNNYVFKLRVRSRDGGGLKAHWGSDKVEAIFLDYLFNCTDGDEHRVRLNFLSKLFVWFTRSLHDGQSMGRKRALPVLRRLS